MKVKVDDGRLGELRLLLADEHTELGPLDREDLLAVVSAELDRRIDEAAHSERAAA